MGSFAETIGVDVSVGIVKVAVGVDVAQVKFHRPHGNAKGKSNLFIAFALNQDFDDLPFAFAELSFLFHAPSVMQEYKIKVSRLALRLEHFPIARPGR